MVSSGLVRWIRAAVAGAVGILAGLLVALPLFLLVEPVLFDPTIQSAKLIAVMQTLQPLPLSTTNPALFFAGLAVVGAVHGVVFALIVKGLPEPRLRRGFAYGVVLWALVSVFFEFFTPFNLFGEPLALVFLQLAIWFIVFQVEGIVISLVYGRATS